MVVFKITKEYIMFKLYYTGASNYKATQVDPSKSLGGFISDTAIPNDIENSIFANMGELKLWTKKKIVEYIGIAGEYFFFEGEQNVPYKNLTFRLDLDEEQLYSDVFSYKIGIGPIGGDASSGYYMEQISQIKAKPFYLSQDFRILEDGIPITFEKIATETGIGIWISRTFDPVKFDELFNENSSYWDNNNKLPELDFSLSLSIATEDWIDETP